VRAFAAAPPGIPFIARTFRVVVPLSLKNIFSRMAFGPPIMRPRTLEARKKLGFGGERIVTTRKKRVHCGVGRRTASRMS